MSRSRRRRGPLRPVPLTAAVVAAVAAVAAAVVLVSQNGQGVTLRDAADSSAPLEASYQAGTGWGTGYDGQYTITNAGDRRGHRLDARLHAAGGYGRELALGRLLHRRRRPGDGDERQLGRHHPAGRHGHGRLRDDVLRRGGPARRLHHQRDTVPGARARARRPRRRRAAQPPPRRALRPAPRRAPRPPPPRRAPPPVPRRALRPVPRRIRRRGHRRTGRPGSPRTSTRACTRRSAWSPPRRRPA